MSGGSCPSAAPFSALWLHLPLLLWGFLGLPSSPSIKKLTLLLCSTAYVPLLRATTLQCVFFSRWCCLEAALHSNSNRINPSNISYLSRKVVAALHRVSPQTLTARGEKLRLRTRLRFSECAPIVQNQPHAPRIGLFIFCIHPRLISNDSPPCGARRCFPGRLSRSTSKSRSMMRCSLRHSAGKNLRRRLQLLSFPSTLITVPGRSCLWMQPWGRTATPGA